MDGWRYVGFLFVTLTNDFLLTASCSLHGCFFLCESICAYMLKCVHVCVKYNKRSNNKTGAVSPGK